MDDAHSERKKVDQSSWSSLFYSEKSKIQNSKTADYPLSADTSTRIAVVL